MLPFFLSLEAVLLIHKEHIDSEMESSHYVILQTLAEPFSVPSTM